MKKLTWQLIGLFVVLILAACQTQQEARLMNADPAMGTAAPDGLAYEYAVEAEPLVAPPAPGQPPADMFFENYGINPVVTTADDNLSTFAIDVDTGSYTLMRRYLTDGLAVPPDSVRVEEYVNFFAQDYARPERGAFAIHIEGAPSPYTTEPGDYLVRVGIQGYEVPEEERPNALLIFVIDVSGSMASGDRLGQVKDSLNQLVERLRPGDRIGIVVYGSSARTVLAPSDAAEARSTILDAIDRLQPEGSTNAEDGLRVAYRMVDDYYQAGQINRLILCSDGVANVGNTTAETILEHARNGISLSTFGFGMGNYNDTLMEQLADQGDGAYAYVDNPDEARRLFVDNLTGTLLTIAKEAKIQVEFDPAVIAEYRLLGYENRDVADEDFRNDAVDAGEIGAGHSVTALYEVRPVAGADPAGTALTVRVRYADPDSSEVTEIAQSASLSSFVARFTDASARFQLDALVAEYAEILRQSPFAEGSSLANISAELRRVAEYLPGDNDVAELLHLVDLASER